jgi:hypothetical protein
MNFGTSLIQLVIVIVDRTSVLCPTYVSRRPKPDSVGNEGDSPLRVEKPDSVGNEGGSPLRVEGCKVKVFGFKGIS